MSNNDKAAEALRDEFHDLRKWAETSWNRGFQQGLEANRLLAVQAAEALRKEREAHAETNRAMTDALLMMEEREQRDEALLRQALEALLIGRDCAAQQATEYHAAMAGYRPKRHAQMEADVEEINAAIEAMSTRLGIKGQP